MSNVSDLASKKCVPCEGGTRPMPRADAKKMLGEVGGWSLVDDGVLKIQRKFKFEDFSGALAFVNRVGDIAEQEGHHPDINFGWGKATVTFYTHAVSGLSENDFILAAKVNNLELQSGG